ncbi:dosage compensation regulator [Trichuris trichiura]|uniref:RNA helicase n=1 Tax=Trichuris trichiura TaxID=36087 RepID=A0A077Z4L8_TRITR|nr:dosage compensation regulator [Trichuris trichiura]
MAEVKAILNQWAAKRSIKPQYDMRAVLGDNGLQFHCDLTLTGFDHVSYGCSTNKKAAMTTAARDFCAFLLRTKNMDISMFPANIREDIEADSSSSAAPNTTTTSTELVANISEVPKEPASTDSPVGANSSKKTTDIQEDCGGWTLENSKQCLNQFMQTYKLTNFAYEYKLSGPSHRLEFVAEASLPVPDLNMTISASGKGFSKKQASACCAMSLVHQLYNLGVIRKFEEATPKKKLEVPIYDVFVPPPLEQDISDYLTTEGINYVEATSGSLESVSLITEDNDDSSMPVVDHLVNSVRWSPPIMNFNPWTGKQIEDGNWSTMTLEQISAYLFAQRFSRETSESYKLMLKARNELPVFSSKEKILDAVNNNSATLVVGETGCGKTTQVCQYILDSMLDNGKGACCNIIVTQPRRISAITVAERVATERGEKLGQSVGYSVRFDSHFPSPYGSIMFCTPFKGVLLRRMENGLQGVSHIIVDEVHERDVDTDFLLIILRDLLAIYPDLRVILMSATVDTSLFEQYFNGCATVHIEGRLFSVTRYFLEDAVQMTNFVIDEAMEDSFVEDKIISESANVENLNLIVSDSYPESVRKTVAMMPENDSNFELIQAIIVQQIAQGVKGSILVFLPGWNIIITLQRFLETRLADGSLTYASYLGGIKCVLLPLHSQLPKENQFQVFEAVPPGFTKVCAHFCLQLFQCHPRILLQIILATNIAESSVTISDVVMVIDSCKVKLKKYTSYNNMIHYVTTWASKSNLQQRCGRAGRCQPGVCFHLCSKARFERLDQYSEPEMLRSPLHETVLAVKLLGLGSSVNFLSKAMQPPPLDSVCEAEMVLRDIGALTKDSQLTALGRILAHLPIDPVFGKTIVLGTIFSIGDIMCSIAALSSFIEPYIIPLHQKRLSESQKAFTGSRFSDHTALLEIYQCFVAARHNIIISAPFNYGIQSEKDFCRSYRVNAPLLRTIFEATHQLKTLLQNFGFLPELLQMHRICTRLGLIETTLLGKRCPMMALFQMTSLLIAAYYPNVCWHYGKRRVLTLENTTALIHKHSVNCESQNVQFPSPFFVFSEKMRTGTVACRQLSMVTHLQLLLFGAKSVELCDDLVVLDNWLKLRMSPVVAAKIVALRRCVNRLVGLAKCHLTNEKECGDELQNVQDSTCRAVAAEEGIVMVLYSIHRITMFRKNLCYSRGYVNTIQHCSY